MEWLRETDGVCEAAREICIAEDEASDDLAECKAEDAIDAVRAICIAEDEARDDLAEGKAEDAIDAVRAICMAEDEASDDLAEDKTDDAIDAGVDESKGVDSEGGGSVKPVLASRLQTGQKVLHEVSHESTQAA